MIVTFVLNGAIDSVKHRLAIDVSIVDSLINACNNGLGILKFCPVWRYLQEERDRLCFVMQTSWSRGHATGWSTSFCLWRSILLIFLHLSTFVDHKLHWPNHQFLLGTKLFSSVGFKLSYLDTSMLHSAIRWCRARSGITGILVKRLGFLM